jgi:hypothetical protein
VERFERWTFRIGIISLAVGLANGSGVTAALGAGLLSLTIERIIFQEED